MMKKEENNKDVVRRFNTGATRDLDENKYDFEGFISPLVLLEYGKYMHKNRFLADGTVRNSDNWQQGFGDEHFNVCMKSLTRHFMDLWLFHRGEQGRDDIYDALNGILFNTMAYMHQLLKNEQKDNENDNR